MIQRVTQIALNEDCLLLLHDTLFVAQRGDILAVAPSRGRRGESAITAQAARELLYTERAEIASLEPVFEPGESDCDQRGAVVDACA